MGGIFFFCNADGIIPFSLDKKKMDFVPDTIHWEAPLKKIKSIYQEKKEEAIARLGTYALEKFGKSKYARKTFNTLPTSVIAGIFKSLVNFLILYRLATGHRWVDFFISMIVTVITAVISPVFYVIVQEREHDLMKFSNHFTDQLMIHGFDYLRMWQGRTVFALGLVAIVYLSLVEVTSHYLRHWILESLLALWVVDKVNQWRDSIFLPIPIDWKVEFIPAPQQLQLTKYDYIRVPLRRVKLMETPTTKLIHNYRRPRRARYFQRRDALVEHLEREKNQRLIGGTMRNVIEDWICLDE